MTRRSLAAIALIAIASAPLAAQRTDQLSATVRDNYVAYGEPVLALTNVTIIDGTGAPPSIGQTIVIRDGRITAVGPTASTAIPAGARTTDFSGHTVIPGIVGLHDHLFYTAPGGRRVAATYTSTRLYLASGVTTVRTTGSNAPYQDINAKAEIDRGDAPGPRIHITAPYFTGSGNGGYMAEIGSPEQARRFVAYWGEEGATWLKSYTSIKGEDLKAAIDEAHKRGMKVTGHLCSVSFQEAVALGIDNLEHGLFTASDFDPNRQSDRCSGSLLGVSTRDENANPDLAVWNETIRTMVDNHVPMTSTLAVYEMFFPGRPPTTARMVEAMAPEVLEAYLAQRDVIDKNPDPPLNEAMLHTAMAFEKAFHDAGGLLAAGVDPTGIGGALPGYGDQRNYLLLLEAGFTPTEIVKIMTLNGATVLGVQDELGSIEVGKLADLVVLGGDLLADPGVIEAPHYVFKDGVGYDSAPLIASVAGRVGIN
jgi:imidazolonepropionase-like amidohydrolase